MIIVKAENLIKSYQTNKKNRLEVLRSVSVEIEVGKISVIIGASGAGKSTLLHLLGGLDRPDSGNVFYDGTDIFKLSDDKLVKFRRENIGFVFQFHHLLPEFSAIENTAIPLMIKGESLQKALSKTERIIELVGLKERKNHKPAELSGGEQQRVAVARALANNPSIIFADEPTGNLDSDNSELINQLILDLKNNHRKTLLIVTHNKELMKLADKVFEMKDGRIINDVGRSEA
ncbi:MAG: ABC transporter ATP-binding protein [Ignavibacteria bacterium]